MISPATAVACRGELCPGWTGIVESSAAAVTIEACGDCPDEVCTSNCHHPVFRLVDDFGRSVRLDDPSSEPIRTCSSHLIAIRPGDGG